MIARHIHHALAQVQELQQKVIESQRFTGYSGRARAASGTIALLATVLLHFSSPLPAVHLTVWTSVFIIGMALNYGGLAHWFLYDPSVKRDLRRLKPAFDVFPPLIVGGVLTLLLLLHGLFDYLFGTWMCLFGLMNFASSRFLPKGMAFLGAFYITCGTIYFFSPNPSFLNPWPMGLVFFIGEWTGGLILAPLSKH